MNMKTYNVLYWYTGINLANPTKETKVWNGRYYKAESEEDALAQFEKWRQEQQLNAEVFKVRIID